MAPSVYLTLASSTTLPKLHPLVSLLVLNVPPYPLVPLALLVSIFRAALAWPAPQSLPVFPVLYLTQSAMPVLQVFN